MVLGLLAVRLVRLNADPPQVFPNGFRAIEPFTDEAAKAYQARNRALFGQWNTSGLDEYRFWKVLSPVWCYPLWIWFKCFGVGYASMRLFSIFWFGAGLILIYFSLRKNPGGSAPIYAVFFAGINFYLLIFSRLGLMETMLNTFLLLAFFLAARSAQHKWLFPFSVLALLVAYFLKQNALLLAPVMVAGYCAAFGPPWRRDFWASPANYISIILALVCALFLWHLWHEQVYHDYTTMNLRHGYGLPPSKMGLILRLDFIRASVRYHLSGQGLWENLFAYDPVAAGLAIIDLLAIIYLMLRRREFAKTEILAGIWLVSIQVLMLASSARVIRFWIIQLPAMVILAGAALGRLQKAAAGHKKMFVVSAIIILAVSFEFNFHSWLNWQNQAQYQTKENSEKIEQALAGKPAVVVGKWAGPLVMPSSKQYYYIKNIFNRKPDQMRSFKITHLLLGDVPSLTRSKAELENDPYLVSFQSAFPRAFEQKKPVAHLKFYDGDLTLFKVDLSLDQP